MACWHMEAMVRHTGIRVRAWGLRMQAGIEATVDMRCSDRAGFDAARDDLVELGEK